MRKKTQKIEVLFLVLLILGISIVSSTEAGSQPKPGHWQGESSIFFEVASNGEIRNLTMSAALPLATCDIKAEKVTVDPDGKFVFSRLIKEDQYWPGSDRASLKKKGVWPKVVKTKDGPMIEVIRITGKFVSPNKVTGTYRILACEDQQFLWKKGEGTEKWDARWESP